MNKIRIIDLLNKIANGEEVPQKIKFRGFEYWYEENMEDYKNAQTEYSDYIIGAKFHYTGWLNFEVEIIEEEKEIEKIRNINIDMDGNEIERTPNNYELKDKINELIDAVNELKRGN